MCGICGIVSRDPKKTIEHQIENMSESLIHRGPDDSGIYYSEFQEKSMQVGLGFRRLSILDLAGGHQPMQYKHLWIVFNGEIYNYRSLKQECERLGHSFQTQSDTEVILHLFEEYHEKCLDKLNGMFAFAIWNEREKELFLARDRLGIKPLFYYHDTNKFIFSSEMRSLYRSGDLNLELDPVAVRDFYNYRFVPAPTTILKNTFKVLPGTYLYFREWKLIQNSYWNGISPTIPKDKFELETELLNRIDESVQMQMISDVPLGAFLSGGVDSSLITALMVRHSSNPVKTFSIGFEKGTGVDESRYARRVSQILHTEHHEFILTEKDLASADEILFHMNEPVADPTILPTALLSRFARQEVKVVLTGEGGDELFAGYNRYKSLIYSQWIQSLPQFLKGPASSLFPNSNIDTSNWYPLHKDISSESLNPFLLNLKDLNSTSYLLQQSPSTQMDLLNSILYLEMRTSLPERLLAKVDMSSMNASLEARPPYLDHRIVELSLQIPARLKIRYFKGKHILRKIASRYLPSDICWRRKHGFIVPLSHWISSHSEDWVRSVLDETVLVSTGLFEKKSLHNLMESCAQSPTGDSLALLWPTMVLSSWIKSLKKY